MLTYDPYEVIRMLEHDTEIVLDSETTGLSPWRDKIALLQLCGNVSKTPILFRGVCYQDAIDVLNRELFTPDRLFIGHNLAAFDLLMLYNGGFTSCLNSNYYDTLIAECVISTTGRHDVSKSLKASIRRRLGLNLDKDIEHGHWMAPELSPEQIQYAEGDVIHLHRLRDEQVKIATEKCLIDEMMLEMSIIPVVAKMTLNGLPVDVEKFIEYREAQENLEMELRERMVETFGSINFNSHTQLKKAMFERFNVRIKSTNQAALAEHAYYEEGEFADACALLLEYKKPQQFLKTYGGDWLDKYMDNGRVHARFWQAGTDTLRFSSSNPNMQQVPRAARGLFGGLAGHQIIAVDYSQLEVRIAAAIAQDDVMKRMLKNDDVHAASAAEMYQKPQSEVTKEERRSAKAATFTLLFGGTARALYANARKYGEHMTMEMANSTVETYFNTFHGLRRMRQKAYAIASSRRVATVLLPYGAKRVLVGNKLSPATLMNTPVQGTAAIGLKVVLRDMWQAKSPLMDYIGITVHDELVGAFPDEYVEDACIEMDRFMVEGMKKVLPEDTDIITEAKVGTHWKS